MALFSKWSSQSGGLACILCPYILDLFAFDFVEGQLVESLKMILMMPNTISESQSKKLNIILENPTAHRIQ